jgi:hypothetical protein
LKAIGPATILSGGIETGERMTLQKRRKLLNRGDLITIDKMNLSHGRTAAH